MERKDIESQLHEQYAINNNSKLGTVVPFIVAMLAVFGAYGYVYLYTSPELPSGFRLLVEHCKCCNYSEYEFTLWALFLVAIAVYFVLWIIFRICIYQGSAQRREQFITFSIRYKAYRKNLVPNQNSINIIDVEDYLSKEYNEIFPNGYHPFGKGRANFIQGLYGEIVKIIHVCSFLISITLILKVVFADVVFNTKMCLLIFPIIICVICFIKFIYYIGCYDIIKAFCKERYYKRYSDVNDKYVKALKFNNRTFINNKNKQTSYEMLDR